MEQQITPLEALNSAVERAGSQSALARICGVGQPAVWKWLQSAKRLPAEHVLKVEAATGVSRHLLRPDIYPTPITIGFDAGEDCGPILSGSIGSQHFTLRAPAPAVEDVSRNTATVCFNQTGKMKLAGKA